jgi:hypothetical protein
LIRWKPIVTKALTCLFIAAGLAGCAGGTMPPTDTRSDTDRPLPPGEGMFGNAFTWEWRKKEEPAPQAAKPAAAPAPSAATKPEPSASERSEFEDWRAWQEWKRKNPK